jgi:hypothetical protein
MTGMSAMGLWFLAGNGNRDSREPFYVVHGGDFMSW